MKKFLTIPAVIGALVFATGCDESYDAVNGSEPPQVVVRDAGDKIDQENINRACTDLDREVANVQYIGNGKTAALVTCTE